MKNKINKKGQEDLSGKQDEQTEESKAKKRLEDLKEKFDKAGNVLQKMIDQLTEKSSSSKNSIEDQKNKET